MTGTLPFDTAFGRCRIGWSGKGLCLFRLPGPDGEGDGADGPGAGDPPAAVTAAIAKLRRYFAGEAVSFDDVPVDLDGVAEAYRRIYDAARRVSWGETVTYGELARRAGMPGAARLVGQAMAANPVPVVIPCHRVLGTGGRLGGFSASGGAATKERLLILERTRLAL